ncbi:PQQ-dependent dehydrogenase, methanol/ethanol family [Solimonas marina]|uniref:PQQ-dependent dehydrogenase, methanol/ethanol family n=1 Tax=Solimonas marina TaxID=2714601 RepID=A0A970B3P2_9GAMM|nr:PQQ-dependent dehydrogenase, methanol/ethanol family [Solimonas marina]NKF21472.1 PQQ-dependent dehydrogenase, methanol/ethanol family [Solimonas marina]
MKSLRIAAHAAGVLLLMGLAGSAAADASVIDNQALADDTDGTNWAAYGRTFDEQHYSPLTQINTDNVGRLGLAWSLDLDDVWNVSTVPIEVDGVLYVAAGFSVIHAIDVRSGKLLWKYDPKVRDKMRMAWGIRGMTYWNGKVYAGAQDGRLFALDAHTGALVWETLTTEPGDNRYITGAPRAFNGKIIIGHGGADFGHVRGYVTAYDAETGRQDWRFWLVPGNPADGFENKAMEMAAKTWKGQWWKYGGGGTAWNAITYDPKYNRIYIGAGNGGPWNAKLRSPGGGDNLFLCSIVAVDADTGEYVWHYQTTPDESWDFTSTMDITLATIAIDGKPRDVILHAPKNGFFYVIDRATGKLISAEKLGKVTWAKYVDKKTGRPVEVPGARYEDGEALIWPGSAGMHNWPPMSYSPATGLTYIPVHEMAGYYNDAGRDPKTWTMSTGDVMGVNGFNEDVPANAGSSSLLAWNPVTQKKAWSTPTPGANNGGTMATAGNLVFQGQADGQLVAHDAKTGAALWHYDMGVGTMASPISYEVDGKQYVTIPAGWAGGQMLLGSLSAQHGWVGRDHPRRILTFVLDGQVKLPPSPPPSRPTPLADADFHVDPVLAKKGEALYGRSCVICHGVAVVAGGYAPDLRASAIPLSSAAFTSVVRDGGLVTRGMPPFAELSDDDLLALQHYIRQRARYQPTTWDKISNAWHFITLMLKMKLKAWFG